MLIILKSSVSFKTQWLLVDVKNPHQSIKSTEILFPLIRRLPSKSCRKFHLILPILIRQVATTVLWFSFSHGFVSFQIVSYHFKLFHIISSLYVSFQILHAPSELISLRIEFGFLANSLLNSIFFSLKPFAHQVIFKNRTLSLVLIKSGFKNRTFTVVRL